MIKNGDNAPDFKLHDQNDNITSLSDFKGQWLVLYFYPKDDTPGCTKEACDFSTSLKDFNKIKVPVFGVSPDSPQSHRKFIEKYDIRFSLLSDPEKKTIKSYEAWGVKKNYGKEYEGLIRSTFIISPLGKIAGLWNNVKVRQKKNDTEIKHADIVLEELKELKS